MREDVLAGPAPLVRIDHRGPATWITLDSPANRNALSRRLVHGLAGALDEAAGRGARLVVLTGAGNTFCSGADLGERLHPPATGAPPHPEVTVAGLLTRIAQAPLPVLARVNGHVRAGGMGLVAAADLAVAPMTATFGFSEVRVGVAPAMIAVPALRVMTTRALQRHMLTGEPFAADEAERSGLLTQAFATPAEMDGWISTMTETLGMGAPGAVAATKQLLSQLRNRDWDEGMRLAEARSDQLFDSAEASEGMRAFLEKRRPRWWV